MSIDIQAVNTANNAHAWPEEQANQDANAAAGIVKLALDVGWAAEVTVVAGHGDWLLWPNQWVAVVTSLGLDDEHATWLLLWNNDDLLLHHHWLLAWGGGHAWLLVHHWRLLLVFNDDWLHAWLWLREKLLSGYRCCYLHFKFTF